MALNNAVKIDPKDVTNLLQLAHVFEKEENWRKAFNFYRRILDVEPHHRPALLRLARLYLAGKETELVDDIVQTLLSRDSKDAFARTLQAAVWSLKGKHQAALKQAQALLAQAPTEIDTVIVLAAVLAANNQHEKANAVLQTGLRAHPNDVDLLNYLATTYVGRGVFQEAEEVFLRLVRIEPHVLKHRDNLAKVYRQLKKPEKAVALLREGVELNPTDEKRWRNLVLHVDSSQREKIIHEALDVLPHSMMLRFLLAAHFEQQQESGKARVIYEAIIEEEETSGSGLKAEVSACSIRFGGRKTGSCTGSGGACLERKSTAI